MRRKRVIVIDAVGLGLKHFGFKDRIPHIASLLDRGKLLRMKPVFPALTLPAQASLTTGAYPDCHGIVANGFYTQDDFRVSFWEQAASLVQTERIWDRLKKKKPGMKSGAIFFQNTLYAGCDTVMTPKPIHADGRLIHWCYSKPPGLYEAVTEGIGQFNLYHYWGPLASIESSRWIAKAAVEVIDRVKPDLLFVYLPHLDYCSQRLGPDDPAILDELSEVDKEVGRIIKGVEDMGLIDETTFIVLSEYVFSEVKKDIPINRALRESGLLKVRTIEGREYIDFELTPAFAMADHQIAHIYVKSGYAKLVRDTLQKIDGIEFLLDGEAKKHFRVEHARSGDLVAISSKDKWFSYYWWNDRSREPEFAARVDIHRKPGYDPLELFTEPGSIKVPQDTLLIKGSHGYPALSEEDAVPFLISGEGKDSAAIPETISITDVASVIERILVE